MHVQPATPVGLEHRRAEQAHVPGRHDDVDPAITEEVHHGAIERPPGPRSPSARARRTRCHRTSRPFERLDVGAVREHEGDPGAADRVIEESLQVRPGAGNEHRDPLPHGRGHATRGPVHAGRTLSGVEAEERAHGIPERRGGRGLDPPSRRRPICSPSPRPTAAKRRPTSAASITRAEPRSPDAAPATSPYASPARSPCEAACSVPSASPPSWATPRSRRRRSPTGPSPGRGWRSSAPSLALLATVGPWTRTGAGDRLFGAWVPSVRWSMVAAVAAAVATRRPRGGSGAIADPCRSDPRDRGWHGGRDRLGPRDRLPTDVPGRLVGPVGRGASAARSPWPERSRAS